MRKVLISDVSMKQPTGAALSFREKIELAKILDRLGTDVIECAAIVKVKTDSLLIKSIASAVQDGAVAVPVELSAESVDTVWAALSGAAKPRLQVVAPTSSVQMEYFYHKKPAAMLELVKQTVAYAAGKGCGVEFIAQDSCRAEREFLGSIISAAIEAGADTVTVCDTEGSRLPGEIAQFISELRENIPALADVRLGVQCAGDLALADAAGVAAVQAGADEVKVCCIGDATASLGNVAKVIAARGAGFGVSSGIRITELSRAQGQINRLCSGKQGAAAGIAISGAGAETVISVHDPAEAVAGAVAALGYDLGEEDLAKICQAVRDMGRERVSARELDAIVATAALQVPAAYTVAGYMVNTGNMMKSVAQIKLSRNGEDLEGVYAGDGPIDAAFVAIEQIIGKHYELDDFQIQSITEGREAIGETVVKLRSGGRLYSGRGVSTDIIGASIHAYVNAVNKIVYEEAE